MSQTTKRGILAYKLLFLILVCSSVITLVATFIQLATTYQSGVNDVTEQLKQIELTHTKSLSKSLWIFDTAQLKIEMDGILNYPDIHYVELVSNSEKIVSAGEKSDSASIKRFLPLNYTTNNNTIVLGELYLEANYDQIKSKVKEQVFVILAAQGIKTFLVSAFILFIINLLITKHLEKIATYAKNFSFKRSEDLVLDRSPNEVEDELDILVRSINGMKLNLERAYTDLQVESLERKIANDELFKQANVLENIINGIPAYIYWIDLEGKYLGCNDLYANLIGLNSKDILGKSLKDLEELRNRIADFHQLDNDVIETKRARWNREVNIERQHEQFSYVESVVPMFNRNREMFGVLGLFIDISAKKKVEVEKESMREQVLRSAKMASIGELASGIGHEVNNPLAIIQGNLELLESHLESEGHLDEEVAKLVKNQMLAIDRIRGIVDGLRVFARDSKEKNEVVDVHDAISETYKLLAHLYEQEKVYLDMQLTADHPYVLINRNKLQQAILNIISNAKDAVLESSKEEKRILVKTVASNKNLMVEISDTGDGIPEEIRGKIFDSYFTTKPIGKGTGIGLDITRKIIEEVGGRIQVSTRDNEGTSFVLEIPFASEFGKNTAQKLDKRFSGHCLVVDDDDTVRALICKHLESLGFSVDEVPDAYEALRSMKMREYEVLFTDMRMPGMSGIELLRSLDSSYNKPRFCVLITGGLDEQAVAEDKLDNGTQFDLVLNKPFTRKELAQSLNSLLVAAS